MKSFFHILRWIVCAVGVAGLLTASHADIAIVVGINKYPNLPANAQLEGCVNDANLIAGSLKRYGFRVVVLLNGEATKDRILGALSEAKITKKDERFVFFFAGHGSRSKAGGGVILPSDTLANSDSSDLSGKELGQAVAAIPASSRTVLLDSCFSGSLRDVSKSFDRPNFRTRFYSHESARSQGDGSKDLGTVPSNGANNNAGINTSGEICYFTASRSSEAAGEDEIGGQRQGIFTYFLASALDGTSKQWHSVQTSVSARVAEKSKDLQHPTLSSAFIRSTVFADKSASSASTTPDVPASLWDTYNTDTFDTAKIELRMTPDKSRVNVGDHCSMSVKVGVDGYLVVLERGTSDKINLLFPVAGSKSDDCFVAADNAKRLPEGEQDFVPIAAGSERVKAILFSSAEEAQALIDAFKRGSITFSDSKSIEVKQKSTHWRFTSDVSFEVSVGDDISRKFYYSLDVRR